jgi:hypothetical protein
MSNETHECGKQKPSAEQEQTDSGATNLLCSDAALAPPYRKREEQQLGLAPFNFISSTNDHIGLETVNCRKESGHRAERQCKYRRDYHLTRKKYATAERRGKHTEWS